MTNTIDFNVLETIEKIYLHARDSHLRQPFFEALKDEIKNLADYLQVDELSAVLFATSFTISFSDSMFSEVFKYFGMNEFLDALKHRKQIELLFERNLLINDDRRKKKINSYEVPQNIIDKISTNSPLPKMVTKEETQRKFVDLLQELDALSDNFDNKYISFYEFRQNIEQLLDDHDHFPFLQKIKSWDLDDFETFFLLDAIWDALERGDNNYRTCVSSTVKDYYKNYSTATEKINQICNGESVLIKLKLIEIKKDHYRNNTSAKLSKNLVKLLNQLENIDLNFSDMEESKLILSSKIKSKTLFYNKAEDAQLTTVENILTERNFNTMRCKMAAKAMPTGVSVLLHGAPGTGKTETVYQLAKRTKRNIFKVDISKTKTMWFGESEKLVKKIFTEYEEIKKEEKRCPILLFNEADAVIGKRKAGGKFQKFVRNYFLRRSKTAGNPISV